MKTTLIIWLLCSTVLLWGCVDTVKEIYIPVPIPSVKIPWITYFDTKNEKWELHWIETSDWSVQYSHWDRERLLKHLLDITQEELPL